MEMTSMDVEVPGNGPAGDPAPGPGRDPAPSPAVPPSAEPSQPVAGASGPAAAPMVPGPDAAAVTPMELSQGIFRFEAAGLGLEIDTGQGARVTAFERNGTNVLHPLDRAAGFLNAGSTLWTSPQADWSWPPLAAHDEAPYQARIEGPALVAEGMPADLSGTRIAISKRFELDASAGAVHIAYALRNTGAAALAVAPWEVSRHPTGGLTFLAGGAARGDFEPMAIDGHLWLPYEALWAGNAGKVFADAAGWLAHVQGDLLILRSWQDVEVAAQAPGEAEVEVYFAPGYVELEAQGPHAELAAGASREWPVQWRIERLPAGIDTRPGSSELLELVRSLL